ncbi:MAG: hypothetical protein JST55_03845 [Bacteroidetes bacterium]|nr:hypothetical protein [Bacteroidota bacterium]
MKTFHYILSLTLTSFLVFVLLVSGCSNPIENSRDLTLPAAENISENTRAADLEFYVWKLTPVGISPAVCKAYIDIYQGETFIKTIGVTDPDGRFIIQSLSLSQVNYTAYAYTIRDGFLDYYGYKNFYNSGSGVRVSIQVNHI